MLQCANGKAFMWPEKLVHGSGPDESPLQKTNPCKLWNANELDCRAQKNGKEKHGCTGYQDGLGKAARFIQE
jgi:hypothetical protein